MLLKPSCRQKYRENEKAFIHFDLFYANVVYSSEDKSDTRNAFETHLNNSYAACQSPSCHLFTKVGHSIDIYVESVCILLLLLLFSLFNCSQYGSGNSLSKNKMRKIDGVNLPQLFSSEPSAQSLSPLQNSPRSIQLPSPHANLPASVQNGSSVYNNGFTLRSLFFNLQFLTASFQSHVCFSMSKKRPAGQRIACKP